MAMTIEDVIDGVEDWAEANGVPVNEVIYTVTQDVEANVIIDWSYRRMDFIERLDAGVVDGIKGGDGVTLMGVSSGWKKGDDYLGWEEDEF